MRLNLRNKKSMKESKIVVGDVGRSVIERCLSMEHQEMTLTWTMTPQTSWMKNQIKMVKNIATKVMNNKSRLCKKKMLPKLKIPRIIYDKFRESIQTWP